MRKAFFKFCYRIFGWRTLGKRPVHDKYLLVLGPHTSNWDFFAALAARHIFELNSHFLAKHSLFKVPVVGWFLRSIGGFPVDRTQKKNVVDQVVDLYNSREKFAVAITPEGTRSYRPQWKTGFYWIAFNAKIPIYMVGFDYEKKTAEMKAPFFPSGDLEKDIERMKAYFRTVKGKHPEKGVIE